VRDVTLSVQPKKGDVVSFLSDLHSRREAPVNPKIFRLRDDLLWEDVVANYENDKMDGIILFIFVSSKYTLF
jgi:hypothetical protein